MGLNEDLARVTPYSISYVITQDGGLGTTMTLTNNDLVAPAAALGVGSPLAKFLEVDSDPNSQDIQRARLLGDASGLAPAVALDSYCEVSVQAETVAGWSVDADVDAVSTGRGELNITGPAGAGRCLITLRLQHSYDR